MKTANCKLQTSGKLQIPNFKIRHPCGLRGAIQCALWSLPTRLKSGRGQPHSKTWRRIDALPKMRQRLGVRLSSAALALAATFCIQLVLITPLGSQSRAFAAGEETLAATNRIDAVQQRRGRF